MKVLHVIDSMGVGGGAEHSLASLLPLLRDRGVESSVATVWPRVGGLQERLNDAGFPVDVLASSSWPGRVRALRQRITAERPDIVHATLFKSCMLARLATRGTGARLVNSLVSTSYDPARSADGGAASWKVSAVRWANVLTVPAVDRFHAVSEAVAEEAETKLHVRRSRISVIPRGRDARLLGEWSVERRRSTRSALDIPADAPMVLNVGRQDHPKAQAALVRAFRAVVDHMPDAWLLIAGRDGNASGDIRRAIEDLRLGGNVRLLGHRDDIADLYVAADLMAFPSRYEGAAGSIVEAMALRCPVVGSDAPAVLEVLRNGELGVVVPRGDLERLSAEMTSLLDDPARRRVLADKGVQAFRTTYQIDAVADDTVAMYRQVRADSSRR